MVGADKARKSLLGKSLEGIQPAPVEKRRKKKEERKLLQVIAGRQYRNIMPLIAIMMTANDRKFMLSVAVSAKLPEIAVELSLGALKTVNVSSIHLIQYSRLMVTRLNISRYQGCPLLVYC